MVISGSATEVTSAFGAVLGALFNADSTSPANYDTTHAADDRVIVNLLVEHSKAGRLVGAKGINIHSLKQRSGAIVRVEKEPLVSSTQPAVQYVDLLLELTLTVVISVP